jgi:hypothetical protein
MDIMLLSQPCKQTSNRLKRLVFDSELSVSKTMLFHFSFRKRLNPFFTTNRAFEKILYAISVNKLEPFQNIQIEGIFKISGDFINWSKFKMPL